MYTNLLSVGPMFLLGLAMGDYDKFYVKVCTLHTLARACVCVCGRGGTTCRCLPCLSTCAPVPERCDL
jgi:hypothetical protein